MGRLPPISLRYVPRADLLVAKTESVRCSTYQAIREIRLPVILLIWIVINLVIRRAKTPKLSPQFPRTTHRLPPPFSNAEIIIFQLSSIQNFSRIP